MKLDELAEKIGAKVLNPGKSANREIGRIYAGDKMSDLLNEASDSTLLVTNLANPQLLRIAEIMDIPGICLLNDVIPNPELMKKAVEYGATIIVSSDGMSETCGRLNQVLFGKGKSES
jgi:hypothetical protein